MHKEFSLKTCPIGVFDSGIGGLSILRALRTRMPKEDFVYFADTAHNPYGEKSEAFIQERSLEICAQLLKEYQIKALVVACNTATAAAIHCLRSEFAQLPIVGVEPALKPAAQLSQTQRVGVLATLGTLNSAKFAALRQSLSPRTEFVCVAAQGLAERIEALSLEGSSALNNATDLRAACAIFINDLGVFGDKKGCIDTLVLGCTHYPLIREIFQEILQNKAQIVDNAQPVALRTEQLLRGFENAQMGGGKVIWKTSAEQTALLQAAKRWLGDLRA